MNTFTGRLLGAVIASAALITPALASAQDYSAYAGGTQQIQGTVAAINGTWNITVADANGYADSVALHQGTIINPTGLTLEPGMSVTIDGYADGPNFDAMEIDTPYQYQGPPPVAVYYGPGMWYPGYADGWGPSFSLVFNLGNRSFERRAFYSGGEARRPEAPPSGWQNRSHGYIGSAGTNGRPQNGYNQQRVAYAPQARGYAAPAPQQRSWQQPRSNGYSAPQQVAPQQRTWQQPQQQPRAYSAPAQQAAPQQRTWQQPQQQPRAYSAPQQQAAPQRNWAQPQQQAAPQRNWAQPQQQAAPQRNWAPPQQARSFAAPPQQARSFAPPAQQARSYTAPAARQAPAPRGTQDSNGRQHGG